MERRAKFAVDVVVVVLNRESSCGSHVPPKMSWTRRWRISGIKQNQPPFQIFIFISISIFILISRVG